MAGLFSGLFGVGGGVVIVPLLALAMEFPPRVAAATSLLAIAVLAAAAGGFQAAYGNAHVDGAGQQRGATATRATAGSAAGIAHKPRRRRSRREQ